MHAEKALVVQKTTFRSETEVLREFEKFLPPVSTRGYRGSRLALRGADVTPVLLLLARERFTFDEHEWIPYWKDGDYRHETYENIAFVRPQRAASRKSNLGVPSGSKEYARLYREKNADRLRAYQRVYAQKRRDEIAAGRKLLEETEDVFLDTLFGDERRLKE